MGIILSEYICGGYLLTHAAPRPQQVSSEVFPETLISASDCIASFLPWDWSLEWVKSNSPQKIMEQAERLELPLERIPDIMSWATENFGQAIGWPGVYFSLETAKRVAEQYFPPEQQPIVLGLGLHTQHCEPFKAGAKAPTSEPGFAPVGPCGVLTMLNRNQALAEGAQILGFEPLASSFTLHCSWICTAPSLTQCTEAGVWPNKFGLLDTAKEALAISEKIKINLPQGSPDTWLPWLLVRYQ